MRSSGVPKKQGILALTFKNKSDYNKVLEDDIFNIRGLDKFSSENDLMLEIIHSDGSKNKISTSHTYNDNQIKWFKAGSSLNLIANR